MCAKSFSWEAFSTGLRFVTDLMLLWFDATQRTKLSGNSMLNHLLLTTDFSPEADAAIPLALDLAARYDAPLDVMHVMENTGVDFGPSFGNAPMPWTEWNEAARQSSQAMLAKAVEIIRGACKTPVRSVWREGHAAQHVIDYALAEKIDCIVMATHGRSGFSHLVFGSVAERVVRHSHCAVLTVRPASSQSYKIPIRKIVMPTDFSVNADAARPYAIDLARRYSAEIHVVHVFDHSIFYARGSDALSQNLDSVIGLEENRRREALQKYALDLDAQTAGILQLLKPGKPAESILNYAASIDADLIVLSTHGRTGLSHMLIGSVAERLIRTSPCPVLSVKPNQIVPLQE